MDFGGILKPGFGSPSRVPSPPPPSPTFRYLHSSMPAGHHGVETPSDNEELNTFGSPSLSDPRPSSQTDCARCAKGDCSSARTSPFCRKALEVLRRYNPTLTLENSGSVARDHLASERTFLAYVRTSLTIASTGVALVQLFTISAATTNKAIEKYSRPLGAIVIALGLCTLLFGMVRYFTIQQALLTGNYPVARVSTILLALVLGAIIVVIFGVIVGVRGHR